MIYLIIAILGAAVGILTVKLILLKNEIRKATARLPRLGDRTLSVDSVDKDLSGLISEINNMYEKTLEIRNNASVNEKTLRNSISMVTHDMKTPLTSVIGYLQLSLKSEGEEAKKNIEIALERAVYLNTLVNDFFEVSLIDSEKYSSEPEEFNICELICEEIFALAPSFDKRGIVPQFGNAEENIRINTDKKMLKRIIQNLLSNCIKYSEGKTELSAVKTKDRVTITVTSACRGKVDTEKLFQKYYREDEARSGEGAGLGMYICKRFADRLGGDIRAEQNEGDLIVSLEIPDMEPDLE